MIDKSNDDGEIDDCGHPPTSPHHAGGEGLFMNQVEDVHCDYLDRFPPDFRSLLRVGWGTRLQLRKLLKSGGLAK